MTHPVQALAGVMESSQPQALVAFGDKAQQLARSWAQAYGETRLICLDASDAQQGLDLPEVQDLALVTDCLEHLSHSQGQTLLGQLRNYGTRQIAVLVRDTDNWSLTDFIGMGFRRQARLEDDEGHLTLYTYNIDNYNHKRDWNNPRFWANPEMWGKAWW